MRTGFGAQGWVSGDLGVWGFGSKSGAARISKRSIDARACWLNVCRGWTQPTVLCVPGIRVVDVFTSMMNCDVLCKKFCR